MKHIVFYQGDNIKGRGFYSRTSDIPTQHSHIVSTEAIVKSEFPLELYEENGVKKVRVDEVKKAKIFAERNKLETIKQKVINDEDITNKELALLILRLAEPE